MLVDNVQQLESFNAKSAFLYPILRDARLHYKNNKIVGFVLIDIENNHVLTIGNGHPDSLYNTDNLDFLKNTKVYCYNKLALVYAGIDCSSFIDVQTQYYLYTNQPYTPNIPKIINHYNRLYKNCYRVGELVSLYKHEEIALEVMQESWVRAEQPGLDFYEAYMTKGFYNIENNGLYVDKDIFSQRFGNPINHIDDYCYTQYNLYTITGRPSNRFGGINFAALNKEDGTRESFKSRYKDGCLLEIDFNSYHPRLISQIIGYDFGTANVYEHLACYYYNTDTPTKEQIDAAKEDTFRQLYGGIQQQYLQIPFFSKTNDMANYMWEQANKTGYLESPISGRRLTLSNYQDINCYTLFNYFIQMYETETNAITINKLHELLKDSDIKLVLYTYDSILFDLPKPAIEYMLNNIIPQAVDTHKFPIKIKKGNCYQDLSF